MEKKRMNILGLTVLCLLMGICMAQDALAGIKVKATVKTPAVRVHISNAPYVHYQGFARRILPVRTLHVYKINKQDQMVARRLADYTGVPTQMLINLRTRGYRWAEIGRWLYLPQPVVRAAMNQKTWKRFLHSERSIVRRGIGVPPRQRVSHIDPAYYENFGEYEGDIDERVIDKYKEKFDDD